MPPTWQTPPAAPLLPPDEVHVWRLDLSESIADLSHLLSPDEQQRADKFRTAQLRQRYIAGRGVLRHLLGRYLQCDPAAIAFTYNDQGKPQLVCADAPPLHFNLSHSHDLVLYALTRDRLVGVDLEFLRPRGSLEAIARRFFAPAEQQALSQIAPDDRAQAFFTGWTRKEAYLKARGEGIMQGLDHFAVSLQPGAAHLLAGEAGECQRWRFVDLHPGPGYLGALCAEGAWQVQCYDWSG